MDKFTCIVLLGLCVYIVNAKSLSFQQGGDRGKVENSFKTISLSTHSVPVVEKKMYQLSFTASSDEKSFYVVENNPRVQDIRIANKNLYPSWVITFKGEKNKKIKDFIFSPHQNIIFGKKMDYKTIFYTPLGAVNATVTFQCPVGNSMEICNISLDECAKNKELMINSDFQVSSHSAIGWKRILPGSGLRKINGKTVFDSGYGSESMNIPVDPNYCYRLNLNAEHYGGYLSIRLNFYDVSGKKIKEITEKKLVNNNLSIAFVPPQNAINVSLVAYNCFLNHVSLEQLGSKEIINKIKEQK